MKIKKNQEFNYNPFLEMANTNKKFDQNLFKEESEENLKKKKRLKIKQYDLGQKSFFLKEKYISLPSINLKDKKKKNDIYELSLNNSKSNKFDISKFQTCQSNLSKKSYFYFKKNYDPEKSIFDFRLKDYKIMQNKFKCTVKHKSLIKNKKKVTKFKKKIKTKTKRDKNEGFINFFDKSKKSLKKKSSLKIKKNTHLTFKENITLSEIDIFNKNYIFKTIA